MDKEKRCTEIRAQALANDMLLQLNLPSRLRLMFGTPEEKKKHTYEWNRVMDEHNQEQEALLKELEELES